MEKSRPSVPRSRPFYTWNQLFKNIFSISINRVDFAFAKWYIKYKKSRKRQTLGGITMKKKIEIGTKFTNQGWNFEVVGKEGNQYLVHCVESNHTFKQHDVQITSCMKEEV